MDTFHVDGVVGHFWHQSQIHALAKHYPLEAELSNPMYVYS